MFAPGLAAASLPFLVLAICPLSMVLMMGAMNSVGKNSGSAAACALGNGRQPQSRAEQLSQLEVQQRQLAYQIEVLKAEDKPELERRPNTEAAAQPS